MLRLAKLLLPVGALTLALAACGSATHRGSAHHASGRIPPVSSSLAGSCPQIARSELEDVARRIYTQAVTGLGATSDVKRLQRTRALVAATAAGDRAAVRAAFLPVRHQIVRLEVFQGARRIYSYGQRPSFAPVRGRLHDAGGRVVGHFLLAATDQKAYSGLVQRLIGASVVFRRGGSPTARAGTQTVSLPTHAFPSGPMQIDVQIPTPAKTLCGSSPEDTRLRTIGFVGRRLLQAEAGSSGVALTLRHAANDPAFRKAATAGDPVALKAAITNDFFHDHSFHIVRVRVTRGARLIYDLGGAYVLQPATGTVRSPDGRSSASFTLAVQDDTGYIKLVHRFTGADVQLVSPLGKVPGSSLEPGPDRIPDHGPLTYRGRRYVADSFDGTAFPSGRLRVSLLVPAVGR